jgi:hypothetical protein
MKANQFIKSLLLVLFIPLISCAQNNENYVKENYNKIERYITMRDGIKLFTSIYIPKDASASNKYPMMMQRTCYNVAPYGEDNFNEREIHFCISGCTRTLDERWNFY